MSTLATEADDISDAEFEAATRAGEARRARGQAVAVRFFSIGRRLSIRLATGAVLILPVDKLQGLSDAADEDVRDVLIGPAGLSLHFPRLDVDLGVAELLDGVFGTRKWMAQVLGRAGGQAKTERKAEAARENGKLGGRPRRVALDANVLEALGELERAVRLDQVDQVQRQYALRTKTKILRAENEPRTVRDREDEPLRRPRRAIRVPQTDT